MKFIKVVFSQAKDKEAYIDFSKLKGFAYDPATKEFAFDDVRPSQIENWEEIKSLLSLEN